MCVSEECGLLPLTFDANWPRLAAGVLGWRKGLAAGTTATMSVAAPARLNLRIFEERRDGGRGGSGERGKREWDPRRATTNSSASSVQDGEAAPQTTLFPTCHSPITDAATADDVPVSIITPSYLPVPKRSTTVGAFIRAALIGPTRILPMPWRKTKKA